MNDGKSVLIVEDSETQALRLVGLLAGAGIEAHRAATAEEALSHLGEHRPDLIVIDYHLPRMRGDELCRQIRLNPATSDILVLILTGDLDGRIERQGLESGADDHVPKSIDADGLMARIRNLLRNQRRSHDRAMSARASFFHRHRVAIIDDSPTYLAYIAQALEQEGYDVVTFVSAEEALDTLKREGSDCVLVDLVMPRMDGIELCRRLDYHRAHSDQWFPLLMVTARDCKEDMMRALEAGADDFVGKSSDITILRARIRALLRRKVQRDEHERISAEFRSKELEVVRERSEREAAERRAALADELEKANRALKETQAQLIQAAKMASLGELVAGIAHEINNPLSFVMNHRDTVERHVGRIAGDLAPDLSDAQRAILDKVAVRLGDMRGGLERVRDLVLKLRTFSRLDEGEFKRADIRENIESTLTIIGHRLSGRITVSTAFTEDNVIACYPAPLNQAVMNLVNNAIDALDGEGQIDIRTERQDRQFRIIVADNGPGLEPKIRERIFEPFFTTKPVGGGMGLGLAITYRIVQAHKGTIEVGEREGGGAQFVISIPLDLKEAAYEHERCAR